MSDHIKTLSQTRKPIIALAELVWNALDADADEVSVVFEKNKIDGIERIRIIDDGHGFSPDVAETEFSSLGGSWKRREGKSKTKRRFLHGRLGKGRFKAFAIGNSITWHTAFKDNGTTKKYKIMVNGDDPTHAQLSDPREAKHKPGTEVYIEGIHKTYPSLMGREAVREIAELFSLYLKQYPNIKIKYDGHYITTKDLETASNTFKLPNVYRDDGSTIDAEITVIEWVHVTERAMYLCDAGGVSLSSLPTGIRAPGFNFTAYLKSDYIRELDDDNNLELQELHPGLKKLLDAAKDKLRSYFRKRASEKASELVSKWKAEKVYPYEDEARNPVEVAERQVFDVCALNIHSYLPDFEEGSHKAKHLAFRLLKNALETNPAAIQLILGEVLDLPTERQNEFADLLQRTSLDAMITASKTVANRLTFLESLSILLFDKESKKQLLERSQLHRILSQNTWLFGEEFNLTCDDESLTSLLKKHRSLLDDADIVDEVRREDGTAGIVDLVLGRQIPTPRGDEREHLVVELKRPLVKVDDTGLAQIKSYAFAIADDERFRDSKTRWSFWIISNSMTDSVRRQAHQKNLSPGCVYEGEEGNVFVWAKTWSEILSDCECRLKFFQEQLQFRVKRKDALEHLQNEYKKYLPEVFQKDSSEENETSQYQASDQTVPVN